MDSNKNNEIIDMMLEIEYISSIDNEKINNHQYNKFPISKLSALGVGFSELFESTREITQNIETNGLYRCTLPKGAVKLAQAKDGTGALGSALGSNNKLVGMARWHEQDNIREVITIPYNPSMLFMAVTLMSMDKKLDSIEKTQQYFFIFIIYRDHVTWKLQFRISR